MKPQLEPNDDRPRDSLDLDYVETTEKYRCIDTWKKKDGVPYLYSQHIPDLSLIKYGNSDWESTL